MLTFRNKLPIFSSLLVMVFILAACGRGRVDESLLPTAIPTLGVEAISQPVEATATDEPAPPPTDTPTEAPTATEEPTATEAVVASDAQPESPLAVVEAVATEETVEPTLASTLTPTLEVSVTLTPTATATVEPTVEPTVTATLTPTLSATATLVTTATVPITAVQPITMAQPLTATQPITTEDAVTATQTVTESMSTAVITGTNEMTGTGEISSTGETTGTVPVGIAEALKNADPANGQLLTQKNACIGCHSLDEGVKLVGPSWYGLADRAGERVAGQDAATYLYRSIAYPNEYLVEGFPPGLMLQTYHDTLSDQDFADILAFLLTLKAK